MTEIEFKQIGEFSAVNAARKWLQDHGYSYGSMCMDMPIGILKGSWTIAKWRNLTTKERRQLDGQLISKDFRSSPVVIQLKNPATDEEIKAGERLEVD
jgi:hypothetical protein